MTKEQIEKVGELMVNRMVEATKHSNPLVELVSTIWAKGLLAHILSETSIKVVPIPAKIEALRAIADTLEIIDQEVERANKK